MFYFSDLDTNYRILADHIRMATICLSDGMLPDSAPKMRQILRRAFRIQQTKFGIADHSGILEMTQSLTDIVLQTLNYHYPGDNEEVRGLIRNVLEFEMNHMVEQEKQNDAAMKKLAKMPVRKKKLYF